LPQQPQSLLSTKCDRRKRGAQTVLSTVEFVSIHFREPVEREIRDYVMCYPVTLRT
jgi:hypothetical protein